MSPTVRPLSLLGSLVALGTVYLVACHAPRAEGEEAGGGGLGSVSEEPYFLTPNSVEGRPLEYVVLGEGEETILFVASIHGDEPVGTPLLERLIEILREDPSLCAGKRVVVMPRANPDGLARAKRRNAHNVDLDRNFPARDFEGTVLHGPYRGSEPETRFLINLVRYFRPTGIVTIHQAANRLDFEGPAAGWVHRIAAAGPLRLIRYGPRPGSLSSWAGLDLGIPVITMEFTREATDLDVEEAWEEFGGHLLAALRG